MGNTSFGYKKRVATSEAMGFFSTHAIIRIHEDSYLVKDDSDCFFLVKRNLTEKKQLYHTGGLIQVGALFVDIRPFLGKSFQKLNNSKTHTVMEEKTLKKRGRKPGFKLQRKDEKVVETKELSTKKPVVNQVVTLNQAKEVILSIFESEYELLRQRADEKQKAIQMIKELI